MKQIDWGHEATALGTDTETGPHGATSGALSPDQARDDS